MKTERHLLIPKIERGIVIDHIPAGLGLRLLEMMQSVPELAEVVITLGLNYASKKCGRKDMIKCFAPELSQPVLDQMALLAPGITIKRVEDFDVVKRYALQAPAEITGLVACLNPNCVTNNERGRVAHFHRLSEGSGKYRCHYCERVFPLAELEMQGVTG